MALHMYVRRDLYIYTLHTYLHVGNYSSFKINLTRLQDVRVAFSVAVFDRSMLDGSVQATDDAQRLHRLLPGANVLV